jgi:hypothetical protein
MPETWISKNRHIRHDAHCLLCGDYYGICAGEKRAHPPSICKACGTPQCWTNGLARGQCSICLIGLLDRFSARKCGYAGCGHDAVAAVPRVKYACKTHLAQAKIGGIAAEQYVTQRLNDRSKNWERIDFDWASIPTL